MSTSDTAPESLPIQDQESLSQISNGQILSGSISNDSPKLDWMPELTEEGQLQIAAWNQGARNEAVRLKERLSHMPYYAEKAARIGERYWLSLAGSYRGI